jgi:hypothetical protein
LDNLSGAHQEFAEQPKSMVVILDVVFAALHSQQDFAARQSANGQAINYLMTTPGFSLP